MLKQLICEVCNNKFDRYISQSVLARGDKHIYCSKKCHGIDKSKRNGKIVNCNGCNKEIQVSNFYLKNLKTHYCNRECQKIGKHINIKCEYCAKEFTARKWHLDRGQARFCSRKCWGLGERGENNPSWKGGKPLYADSFKNSTIYTEWRKSVYKRDEYTCQKCDAKNTELHAHHIMSYKGYPKFRVDKHNGITFCKPCHKLFHNLYGIFNFRPEDTFEYLRSAYNINEHKELLLEGRANS